MGKYLSYYKQKCLDYANFIDVNIYDSSKSLRDTLDLIMSDVLTDKKILTDKKGRKYFIVNDKTRFQLKQFRKHLRLLLTNLKFSIESRYFKSLAINYCESSYRLTKTLTNVYIRYKYLLFIIEYLHKNKYIIKHKGKWSSIKELSRTSTIEATQKLKNHLISDSNGNNCLKYLSLPIEIKEGNKPLSFDLHDVNIFKIITQVNLINRELKRHDIMLNLSEDKLRQYFEQKENERIEKIKKFNEAHNLVDITPKPKAITERISFMCNKYKRIFNRDTSLDYGGRFYGHWSQQVPKELRKFITIDGQETVELDYSCLHITMLYCRENIIPTGSDQYFLKDINPAYRNYIKKAVNIMLNAKNKKEANGAIREEWINNDCLPPKPKAIIDKIILRHKPIENYFLKDIGVKLQKYDSDIANSIMLTFSNEHKCCLSIHDSFIVTKSDRDELYQLMQANFMNSFGYGITIK